MSNARPGNKQYGYSIPGSELEKINTICILCWGLLGDVFMRVTTIEAIAKHFPNAKIIVVTDPGSARVFNNNPYIHEVIGYSRKINRPLTYIYNVLKKLIYLRNQKFDLCVNLYAGGSSSLISYLTGSKIRLSFDHTKKLRKYSNLLVKIPSRCGKWVRVVAEIVRPLGIDPDSILIGTNYYVADESRRVANEFLRSFENKKIIYNIGAGRKDKIWPLENHLELARRIYQNLGAIPVILTSPGHEKLAEEFINKYKKYSDKYIHIPKIDFDIEAAVVKDCDLMFTADSGLKHLAAGVKIPILGFYTETRPENTAPLDVPTSAIYIEIPDELDECGYHKLEANIPVEIVYDKMYTFVVDELEWEPLKT